jgi:hypothetical protein
MTCGYYKITVKSVKSVDNLSKLMKTCPQISQIFLPLDMKWEKRHFEIPPSREPLPYALEFFYPSTEAGAICRQSPV